MLIHPSGMRAELKEKMRGGEGTVKLLHLVEKEHMKNARLMAQLTISPGSGIGTHEHSGETEYFIIQKGRGIALDNDREKELNEGDVLITGGGESHNIRNEGPGDLVLLAVIITD